MRQKSILLQYSDIIQTAIAAAGITTSRRLQNRIIEVILVIMTISKKINFTQMERTGRYCEKSYRQLYSQRLDWLRLNVEISKMYFPRSSRKAIIIDPSFVKKSGEKTPHVGKFWSGTASAMKHGLEVLGISLVDIDKHDSIMLRAEQTRGSRSLELQGLTLTDCYLETIRKHQYELRKLSKYFLADAWFSKYTFTEALMSMGFHLISRLRDDSKLYYLDPSEDVKRKRGRKSKFDGRLHAETPRSDKMHRIVTPNERDSAWTGIVYCRSLKRKIRLVIFKSPGINRPKLFFSTDINMGGDEVLKYYMARFQVEFNFRDAKQHTGFEHCQARHEDRLDFAFNASMTAMNVAKVQCATMDGEWSIGRLKKLMVSLSFGRRILCMFGKIPNNALIRKLEQYIIQLPEMAA